ncbi:hypothetical protein CHRY9390_01651 [Chryseobacterium aquaeductus]|uniref:TonB C-terminal domain-containing protein n=1 Tax=Chryseobacterium aquaeductus TaxID=2675056 RepID=A0A9N8QS64_9FLAO|nr:hypothetical protein [Chryseobacterium aquaeductus]CAA7330972.1 hypothetical protein CHRY9390_01651 [Chryseobacterium potabilaquae]CAD7807396.1 hypothetical protein CHRY9390_01651 [Chryseobacterium aquaeductus]
MINKIFTLTLLFISGCINAQVLYEYPKDQDFYEGGRKSFYNEIQETVVKNNVKPCEKTEALLMRFIVYPDNKVRYVADADVNAVENNKCLKSKVLDLIKNTNKWKPAEVNGTKTAAMFCALFSDDLLFKKQLDEEDFSKPVYMHKDKESDIMKFRENFIKCFDVNGYRPNGNYSFKINFDVDTNGDTGFFYIENQSNLPAFNEMVVKCASNTKKSHWKPAYFKGVPVKQFFKMPIKFADNN